MRFRLVITILGLTAWSFSACRKDYSALKQHELATGVRHDSIFMGMSFGMPREAFYQHCFALNKAGIVTNGPQNNSVLYVFSTGYRQPIDLNFYPDFKDDKIYRMKIWFDYESWAPWNKEYYADKLVPEALSILEKWFGSGFSEQHSPDGKTFWAQVHGNREITLRVQDDRYLRGDITDLRVTPPPDPTINAQPDGPRPLWDKPAK